MLTPKQLAHCADDMILLYSQLENEIIRDITRRIVKTGTITDTAHFQVDMLQEAGAVYSDITVQISRQSGVSQETLKSLFESNAVKAMEYDSRIYFDYGLEPHTLRMSPSALQVLEAGFRKTNGNLENLTRTTAKTSQWQFVNACSLAELKVSTGGYSYQTAVWEAVQSLAQHGLEVEYPSGHKDKLDVAVRRNVMTGIGQTTGEICLGYAREMGCDLMEITAHAGARPSHAAWQGQIVSLSGQDGYLSLSDIGYGTGGGFKGWNCRHDWYPYFEGFERMYSKDDLQKLNEADVEFPDGSMHTQYEAEQMQRKYERAIRQTRRELCAADETMKTASDEALQQKSQQEFNALSVKLKRQEAQLNNFCDKTGLMKQPDRIRTYGFGRSTSGKASHSAKSLFSKWSKEHNVNNIETLADYYKIKYNDTERYTLLKSYVKSVDKGMLSPLVGFDKYEEYHARVQNELVGLTTSDGTVIKSQSKHFLERVFGTTSDPTHGDVKREGVSLEDIKDALLNGKVKNHYVKDANGNRVVDLTGFSYLNNKCSVSLNPITGNLIQVSPKSGRL